MSRVETTHMTSIEALWQLKTAIDSQKGLQRILTKHIRRICWTASLTNFLNSVLKIRRVKTETNSSFHRIWLTKLHELAQIQQLTHKNSALSYLIYATLWAIDLHLWATLAIIRRIQITRMVKCWKWGSLVEIYPRTWRISKILGKQWASRSLELVNTF